MPIVDDARREIVALLGRLRDERLAGALGARRGAAPDPQVLRRGRARAARGDRGGGAVRRRRAPARCRSGSTSWARFRARRGRGCSGSASRRRRRWSCCRTGSSAAARRSAFRPRARRSGRTSRSAGCAKGSGFRRGGLEESATPTRACRSSARPAGAVRERADDAGPALRAAADAGARPRDGLPHRAVQGARAASACSPLLAVGWLYRDRVRARRPPAAGRSRRRRRPSGRAASGRPGARALASARAKIDSLNGWRADSVVLSPSEVASLMGSGLDARVPAGARLAAGRAARRRGGGARPAPHGAPAAGGGRPARGGARGRDEPVEATGPLRVIGPGRGRVGGALVPDPRRSGARGRGAAAGRPGAGRSAARDGSLAASRRASARSGCARPAPPCTELHAHESSGAHRRRRGRHPPGAEAGARVRGPEVRVAASGGEAITSTPSSGPTSSSST